MNNRGLDLIDQKILYELDLNSSQSFLDLATKVDIPNETVAFRVKRLQKNGYIKNFITTINTSNLNSFYYKFFFKFQKTIPKIEKDIINYLCEYNGIAYLARLEGRYDCTFLVLAEGIADLYAFLIPFKEKFGEYILEQEILTMTSVHRFNFRFFYENGKLLHSHYPEELKKPEINDLDYAIITTLAKNSRGNLNEIAKTNKVHPNVIRYRIQKLKKAEILGSSVLDINFKKFGVEQYQVDFTLKDQSSVKKIIDAVALLPESTFATVTLGKYDLAVEFAVKNREALKRILDGIKIEFSDTIISQDIFEMEEYTVNWFPYSFENKFEDISSQN
ncbi:MAG: Transcriptional regulator [Parcubacteria group bacterium GW2011_GWA2_36_24]|nr:MAG: Transcriptional regulator [Parcubacteria group bacterium GW2011_GWA2_36_24]